MHLCHQTLYNFCSVSWQLDSVYNKNISPKHTARRRNLKVPIRMKWAEDTVNLPVVKERTGLCLIHVQNVRLGSLVVGQHKLAPGLYLLGLGVTIGLNREERREVVLPRPLEP